MLWKKKIIFTNIILKNVRLIRRNKLIILPFLGRRNAYPRVVHLREAETGTLGQVVVL